MDTQKTYIVIPAFNEAKAIGKVIDDVRSCGYENIIVVDDGSKDSTFDIAKDEGCIALRHIINRGKGAATQTGLDAAKLLGAEFAVTIDADGQHSPLDIENMLKSLYAGEVDVTMGSRFLELPQGVLKNTQQNKIPAARKLVNEIGNLITYVFYGIYVSDSQSGFRAYNSKALNLIKTTFDRYEFESEVVEQISIHKLKFKEVPISVSYSEYSMNKWKDITDVPAQTFMNGFKMFFKMIIRAIST